MGAEPDLRRGAQERLGPGARRRPIATSSSTTEASAPSPRTMSVRPTSGPRRPERPSGRRSAAPRGRPAGTCTTTPWVHAARDSSASFSSPGSSGAAVQQLARERLVRGAPARASVRRRTPAARAVASIERERRDAVLAQLEEPCDPVGAADAAARSTPWPHVRGGALERRGTQVHVRRVEAVALDRQRLEPRPGRRGGRRAARRARRRVGDSASTRRAVHERERQVGPGPAGARPRRRPAERTRARRPPSSQGPFHLQLDEPVELDRVLHRELLGEHLEEALHDEVRAPRSRSGRGSSGRRPAPRRSCRRWPRGSSSCRLPGCRCRGTCRCGSGRRASGRRSGRWP